MKMKKAASLGPAAGNVDQQREYRGFRGESRPNLLEQAAHVLLLLQLPLDALEQQGLWLVFEQRLEQVYRGPR